MKKFKILGIIALVCALVIVNVLSVFASEIIPLYDNCNWCKTSFEVSNGEASVGVDYKGIEGSFSQAKVTVKIQKKFLGVFWNTVDIGEPNNEWVVYSTNVRDYLEKTFPITESGTYRAMFTVEFSGIDGSVDKIEDKLEYKY